MDHQTAVSKCLLKISTLEGAIVFLLLMIEPSKSGGGKLLFYSTARIGLAAGTLVLLIPLTIVLIQSWLSPDSLARRMAELDNQLVGRERLLLVTIILILILMALGMGLWVLFTPFFERFALFIQPVFPGALAYLVTLTTASFRLLPLGIWLLLLSAQMLFLLGTRYSATYRLKWQDGSVGKALFVTFIILVTAAHWIILSFRLDVFFNIPGWKWYFNMLPYQPLQWLALLLAGITLWVVTFVLKNPRRTWLNLALLMMLGYSIQVGYGYVKGQGFESLRLKYADSVFNGYAKTAATEPGLLNALLNYEGRYGADWYLGTKPPGLLIPYILSEKISNLIDPEATSDGRFVRLTRFEAYVFPLAAMLVLPILYFFSRRLVKLPETALYPCILYVVCANVILIPLFLDQVLYPLLFMLVMCLVQQAILRQSVGLAFLAGTSGFMAVYFGFSILPLIVLSFVWVGIDFLFHRSERQMIKVISLLLSMAGGLLLAGLILHLGLNYDFLQRYQVAMAQHRHAKDYLPGLIPMLQAFFLNNVEFAIWTGVPMALLFIARLLRTGNAFLRRKASSLDGLLAAFMVTYLGLGLFGQTRGEVQRLWLFMVPLVCLFVAEEAQTLFKRKEDGIVLVVCLQLVTLFLTAKYQDFYG
jgi:hypothetical protein